MVRRSPRKVKTSQLYSLVRNRLFFVVYFVVIYDLLREIYYTIAIITSTLIECLSLKCTEYGRIYYPRCCVLRLRVYILMWKLLGEIRSPFTPCSTSRSLLCVTTPCRVLRTVCSIHGARRVLVDLSRLKVLSVKRSFEDSEHPNITG